MSSSGGSSKKVLGFFTLTMLNVAAVLSLRNFPSMAEEGWSSVGWYLFGTALFLIPLSLVGAELATGWPQGGGIYAWVREAFGELWGFVAIWCSWANNLVWYPTVLSFLALTASYVVDPALGKNPLFIFGVMMIVFWAATILNLCGTRVSSLLSSLGAVTGAIIPSTIIAALALVYLFSGKPLQVSFSPGAMVPALDTGTLPFVATVVLLFAGMEMAGYHALETRDPSRDFPKAMFASAAAIFGISVIATLAIVFVVPQEQISLAGGLIQAIQAFLNSLNLSGYLAPIALLISIGAVAQMSTWILGPSRALGEAALRGNLPPIFHRSNKYGSPVTVLLVQSVIATLFSLLYVIMPNINSAYWILTTMTVEVICIMYFFVFAAVIKLRYSQPNTPRAYKIPCGKFGIWFVAGVGFIAVMFAFIIGFFEPTGVKLGGALAYGMIVLTGTVSLICPPFIFYAFRRPSWKQSARLLEGNRSALRGP